MMIVKSLAIVLIGVASVSGSIIKRASCNADLCLRSVRATQRTGSDDCASYWKTTFTPTTVISTSTVSVPVVATFVASITDTTTVHVASTTNIPSTQTVVDGATQTSTVTLGVDFWKRQELTATIPGYASACSGAVRYSSACSCVGVSSIHTITLPTPTSWRTISETYTISTSTISSTVDTVQITTIDSTATRVIVESTSTIRTGPTVTVTEIAIKVASGYYADQWLAETSYAGESKTLKVTADASQAKKFYIHSNGRISMNVGGWPGTLFAGSSGGGTNNWIFVWEQNFSFGPVPILCGLTWPDRLLSCSSSRDQYRTFGVAYGKILWGKNDADIAQFGQVVSLRAVKPPN